MLVICARCSMEFERVPSAVKEKNYCSVACRKEPLERLCEACKKPYVASIAHRRTSRFCSKSCAKSGERHHFYGKEGPTKGQSTWIKGLTKESDSRVAVMATKVSQIHKQQFANGARNHKGTNNPNWKPAGKRKTLLNLAIRQTEKYAQWRLAVFQRDGFKCVWCGNASKAINADHIKKSADIIRECNVKSVEDSVGCEALWDINNGRTLCIDCHERTDTFRNKRPKKPNPAT